MVSSIGNALRYIHACINNDSMPLSIVIRLGNEHDYRRLLELVDRRIGLEA
jgi:hypothetical protein